MKEQTYIVNSGECLSTIKALLILGGGEGVLIYVYVPREDCLMGEGGGLMMYMYIHVFQIVNNFQVIRVHYPSLFSKCNIICTYIYKPFGYSSAKYDRLTKGSLLKRAALHTELN